MSDAATSRPMKLAPMTTAVFAPPALGDDRAAIGEGAERQARESRSAPGIDRRRGSAPVASSSLSKARRRPSARRDALAADIEGGDSVAENEVDLPLVEEALRLDVDPVLGRFAGENILGEVGTVDRQIGVGRHDRDAAGKSFPP